MRWPGYNIPIELVSGLSKTFVLSTSMTEKGSVGEVTVKPTSDLHVSSLERYQCMLPGNLPCIDHTQTM
jgi:hypothetical protein